MLPLALQPCVRPLTIHGVQAEGERLSLEAAGTGEGGHCPSCGVFSRHVHGRYQRRPRDLPWRGRPVRLALTVLRFRCPNRGCPRRTFAEPLEPALARHARYTRDANRWLHRVAQSAGGEEGARLAGATGLPASPDTLLRLLRRAPAVASETAAAPRVVGVDDWVRPVLSKQTPESEEERQSNRITKTITRTTWLSMVGGLPTPV